MVVPLEIRGAPGEHAVVSGGRRITGWQETEHNGNRAWTVKLHAVKRGTWYFTQLWVNGRRARRPRLPREGTHRIESRLSGGTTKGLEEQSSIFRPEDRFVYAPGDMYAFRNLSDVDFVALHFWVESRIPLASVDEDKRIATLEFPTRMQLTDNHGGPPAPYYLDNVAEALGEPGDWYLDRPTGVLTYLPFEDETPGTAEIIAPKLDQLVCIEGDAEKTRYAEHIVLRNLTFAHSEHVPAKATRQSIPQAACHVPGAVQMKHARYCTIQTCTVEHVGSYGIDVCGDSTDCTIDRCTVRDTSAGGVRIFHLMQDPSPEAWQRFRQGPWYHPRRISMTDCHICDGGKRWRQGVGVLVGNCSGIQVVHNHIHDFDYTGISIGWTWGYMEAHSYGNIIEWNHIHDIGRGALSDMGGIYTLGQQPGTRLRYNHIHDVDSRGYGGWGIYPDEGSSDILIEFNLVHDTKCDPFSQHYGRDNIVRNNIFALGRKEGMVGLSKFEPHCGYTFERNVVVTDGLRITRPPYNHEGHPMPCVFDHNLYFDINGKRLDFNGLSWAAWRESGQDRHSVNRDPGFADVKARDFRFRDNSALVEIGFIPFDVSEAGVRKTRGRTRNAE